MISRIIGIGTDLVDIRRIEKVLVRYPEKFIQKIFTSSERAYAQSHHSPALTYAKRFAGKEAFSKAIGYGIRPFFSWQDIEILNDPLGKPFFSFSPSAHQKLTSYLGSFTPFLSLSDEYPYAQAFVILASS